MEHLSRDAGARGGDFEAEPLVGHEFNTVKVSIEGSVKHGSGVLDFHAASLAVGATGPAGVDEPCRGAVLVHFIGQQVCIHAGVHRHEGFTKAG